MWSWDAGIKTLVHVVLYTCFNASVIYLCAHLQVGSGFSDEAALILHRKGFDCQFSSRGTGLLCSTTQGKVSFAYRVSVF
jgi:hypothetical protein